MRGAQLATTAADGSVLAVQPLIEALYAGRSDLELLGMVLARPVVKGYDIVRDTFHGLTGGAGEAPRNNPRFEERWREFLHDGFLAARQNLVVGQQGAAAAGQHRVHDHRDLRVVGQYGVDRLHRLRAEPGPGGKVEFNLPL